MKKLTKWGAGLVVVIAMIFMAGQAGAVELGLYETGLLVPQVVHGASDCGDCGDCGGCDGSSNLNTVVGITCINPDGCHVYWTFFDNSSTHVTDGIFEMTKDDFHGFSWSGESGVGLEGMNGYLVFTSGSTSGDNCSMPTGCLDIFANAFLIDAANDDAVFIPVVPLAKDDYHWDGTTDLTTMNEDSIRSLSHGIPVETTVDMRYWMDPDYSAETTIVVWTVCDSAGSNTVNMFNDEEDRKSLNFDLENAELNIIDPSVILGRPADFIDGFIRWTIPCIDDCQNDAMVFTYVNSVSFKAKQTLLAGEHDHDME